MTKLIIIATGLAATGKSTHLKALTKTMPNSVYMDKDDINAELGQKFDAASEYYRTVIAPQTYQIMIARAKESLSSNDIVILDGYFGNKLTASTVNELFLMSGVNVAVIYFHSSAAKQQLRLATRNDPRDNDKIGDKYLPYRCSHLSDHVRELAQVPHLFINTEEDSSLEQNIVSINDYATQCISAKTQLSHKIIQRKITEEEAQISAEDFQILLKQY